MIRSGTRSGFRREAATTCGRTSSPAGRSARRRSPPAARDRPPDPGRRRPPRRRSAARDGPGSVAGQRSSSAISSRHGSHGSGPNIGCCAGLCPHQSGRKDVFACMALGSALAPRQGSSVATGLGVNLCCGGAECLGLCAAASPRDDAPASAGPGNGSTTRRGIVHRPRHRTARIERITFVPAPGKSHAARSAPHPRPPGPRRPRAPRRVEAARYVAGEQRAASSRLGAPAPAPSAESGIEPRRCWATP